MESQPQNPEFRNNPENLHPCTPDAGYSEIIKELFNDESVNTLV